MVRARVPTSQLERHTGEDGAVRARCGEVAHHIGGASLRMNVEQGHAARLDEPRPGHHSARR